MCGHVGVSGSMTSKDIDVFNNLLYFDTVRGPHSTGVAAISRGDAGGIKLLKRVGPAHQLMEHKEYDRVSSLGHSVLIGHNRYATVGKINAANAHPFQFDKIIGAHNGTIPFNERSSIIDGNHFDTDSEGIFNMMNEMGAELTVPALMGAWAFVWYDKEDKTLNMLRNDERELYYVFSTSKKTMYWASEPAMLHAALIRNGIDYDKVMALRPDVHYIFDVPQMFNAEFEEPQCNNLPGRAKSSTVYSYYGASEEYVFGKGEEPARFPKESALALPAPPKVVEELKTVTKRHWAIPSLNVHNRGQKSERKIPLVLGYDKRAMNAAAFKNATKESCVHCDSVVNFEAVVSGDDKVCFINKNQFLCEECANDEWVSDWFIEYCGKDN